MSLSALAYNCLSLQQTFYVDKRLKSFTISQGEECCLYLGKLKYQNQNTAQTFSISFPSMRLLPLLGYTPYLHNSRTTLTPEAFV